MKSIILSAAAGIAMAALSVTAFAAQTPQQLLSAHGCTSCHAPKTKLVGPAWDWVAYRYQGQKGAVQQVANFIISGGTGYWAKWTGSIPMPSHPNLTKAQADELAAWILKHHPEKPPKP